MLPGASAHGGALSRVAPLHDLSRFAGEVHKCAVFTQTDFGPGHTTALYGSRPKSRPSGVGASDHRRADANAP
jgi:hypothetical protein